MVALIIAIAVIFTLEETSNFLSSLLGQIIRLFFSFTLSPVI